MDDLYTSQHPNSSMNEENFRTRYLFHFRISQNRLFVSSSSPSYETCYIDPIGDYTATMPDDPNLFIHHEKLISSTFYIELINKFLCHPLIFFQEYFPSETSFSSQSQSNSSQSSSTCDVQYSWTSLPVFHPDPKTRIQSSNEFLWKQVDMNKKKNKIRNSRKRTKFSTEDLEILNLSFEKNPMPSRTDISILSERLAYPRYIVQVCFLIARITF